MKVGHLKFTQQDEWRLKQYLAEYEKEFNALDDAGLLQAEMELQRKIQAQLEGVAQLHILPRRSKSSRWAFVSALTMAVAALLLGIIYVPTQNQSDPFTMKGSGSAGVQLACETRFIQSDRSSPDWFEDHYKLQAGMGTFVSVECKTQAIVNIAWQSGDQFRWLVKNQPSSGAYGAEERALEWLLLKEIDDGQLIVMTSEEKLKESAFKSAPKAWLDSHDKIWHEEINLKFVP